MLKLLSSISIMFLLFHSCKRNEEPKENSRLFQDSVIREALTFRDSLMRNDTVNYFYDSTDEAYKLMRAICYNDSDYFLKTRESIARGKKERLTNILTFPEKHSPVLSALNMWEGYQFSYGETFCDHFHNLTITQKGDNFNLHTIVYKVTRVNPDSFYVAIEHEADRKLSEKQWDEFHTSLESSDFWGLSMNKNETGFDGSSLRVDGITRNRFDSFIQDRHSVRRRFPQGTALYNSYLLLLRFAGTQKMCQR
jgi:hypothetical protein